jgi:glycosyltransferase involved in cell wall biosynthesis
MSELTVCFYSGEDRPYKRGTILRNVQDTLNEMGVRCTFRDDEIEPDVYVFEKVWRRTRYEKPVVIHAENLIGEEAFRTHVYDRGDAIVFNSEWLRWVYFNTYGTELARAHVIPTGHRARAPLNRNVADPRDEAHLMCISKWWKRPYKRFPLIAKAFDHLNRELGYERATLHVLGWLTDRPMPFVETRPQLWKLGQSVRSNPNIRYHQKGFHDETFDEVLAKTHVVVHVSVIDSGPQVVAEALSQGVPVVISNNMGAAEWVREVGPRAGRVLELDPLTLDYHSISRLPLHRRRLCSDTRPYRALAGALKAILDDYDFHPFEPPHKYTMDGIAERWLEVINDVAAVPVAARVHG